MSTDPAERPKRTSLLSNAEGVRADGSAVSLRVRNLSRTGLGGVAQPPLTRGEPLAVEIKGIGEVCGRVAWVRGAGFGMSFDKEVDIGGFEVSEPFLPMPDHYTVAKRFRPVTEYRRPGFGRAT